MTPGTFDDEEYLRSLGDLDDVDFDGIESALMGKQPKPMTAPVETSPAIANPDTPAAPAAEGEAWAMPEFQRRAADAGDGPEPSPPPMVQAPAAELFKPRVDRGALAKAQRADRRAADEAQVREYLRAAFTRTAPNITPAGPSRVEQMLRMAETERKGQQKPVDPSLAALHTASAENLRALAKFREEEARRRAEADAAKVKAGDEKTAAAKTAAELDAESLESEKAAWLASSPVAKAMKISPELLAGIKTRKGWETFIRSLPQKPAGPPKQSKDAQLAQKVGAVKPGDISTVPPEHRDVVAAIADGRLKAPEAANRYGGDVLHYVMAFKPDFDSTKFGAYKKVIEQQATAKDIVAVDVAREHLGTAKSLIPKNADMRWFNRFKQQLAAGTGDPEFTKFMTAATVSAHETARAYGVEDQEGKRELLHLLDGAQSPEQLHAAFDTFEELMAGKQKGVRKQREAFEPDSVKAKRTAEGGHGAVVKETKSFRQFEDGFIERK